MGATSVTGTGVGSVEKFGGGKGPGNLRSTSVPMQTPHVVVAGEATTSGNVIRVYTTGTKDPLPLGKASYTVIVTPQAAADACYVVKNETNGQMDWFEIHSNAAAVVFDYLVVKAGQGLETSRNWVPESGNSVNAS